jgi:Hpt domain
MEPIDKVRAVECLGGEDVFLATVTSFLTETDRMMRTLQGAVDSGDCALVSEKAHWFKGGLVYLHAGPSVEAAISLQRAAEAESGELQVAFLKLVQEIEKLKQALSKIRLESSRSC